MPLYAKSLNRNEAQKTWIKSYTKEILASIDDDLRNAHEAGKKCTSVTLPITFSIPNMENREAQREIYSGVIIDLVNRGFHPKISITREVTALLITWLSPKTIEEVNEQTRILSQYRM